MSEQNTAQTIRVRQVTDVHSNWSSQGPLENGKFSYQSIPHLVLSVLRSFHARKDAKYVLS